jgi:hypothetical protein
MSDNEECEADKTILCDLKRLLTRLNLDATVTKRTGVIVAQLQASSLTLAQLKQLAQRSSLPRLCVGDSQGLLLSVPPANENAAGEDASDASEVCHNAKRRKRDVGTLTRALADLRGLEGERVTLQVAAKEKKADTEKKEEAGGDTARTPAIVAAALHSEVAISVSELVTVAEGATEGILTVGKASFMSEAEDLVEADLRLILYI